MNVDYVFAILICKSTQNLKTYRNFNARFINIKALNTNIDRFFR